MPARRPLKTADAKLKLLEDRVYAGIWTWDLDSSEVTWSPGLCRILGIDANTVVPTIDLYQSLVHPDDQLEFDDATGITPDRRLEDRRFRIIRPDGSLRWLHSMAQPHFDRSGRTIMMVGVIVDVTEEEALRSSLNFQKEYAKLLSQFTGGRIWRAQKDGKLIETADWTKLTGQTPSQAHDWDALEAIHPEDRQAFRTAWRDAISSGQHYHAVYRVKRIDGVFVTFKAEGLPQRGPDGSIYQWVGRSIVIDHDVSVKADTAPGLTPAEIRAARAYLGWTAPELAAAADVSLSTIRRMENDMATVRPDSIFRVREAFERRGIRFDRSSDGQISISLKR